jgi:hypothetical protein
VFVHLILEQIIKNEGKQQQEMSPVCCTHKSASNSFGMQLHESLRRIIVDWDKTRVCPREPAIRKIEIKTGFNNTHNANNHDNAHNANNANNQNNLNNADNH